MLEPSAVSQKKLKRVINKYDLKLKRLVFPLVHIFAIFSPSLLCAQNLGIVNMAKEEQY